MPVPTRTPAVLVGFLRKDGDRLTRDPSPGLILVGGQLTTASGASMKAKTTIKSGFATYLLVWLNCEG